MFHKKKSGIEAAKSCTCDGCNDGTGDCARRRELYGRGSAGERI